jgi:DNA helicase-2/ATP-dependent DNA helicase PcrA
MSLNHAQSTAVAHRDGPCMVLAGPGSGKTLTIAKRIEYLITRYKVRPEEILVITFTKYAAREMKERFRQVMGTAGMPVTFGTFHGIYYGILKWAYRLDQSNLLTDEEKYALIRQEAAKLEWEELAQAEDERDYLKELAAEIGNIKNNCYDIESYESARYGEQRFRRLYHSYEGEKKRLRKIDFEDMLVMCRSLFLKRPDILGRWQEKFRYILVDEFQDVNQAQYDVVRMLAAPQNNLFVVGDDDQSVYGFRGAKPGIMMEFAKDYPDAKRVLLDVNYRSAAHIVDGALRVIAHNEERYDKRIRAKKDKGETIHVQEVSDPVEEARYISRQIREYRKAGIPYKEMAVLYRTAVDARALSEVLTERQVPFVMKEKLTSLYDHFIGTDIMSYLHLSQGHYERRYFLQVANRPKRYISRDSMREGQVSYESLRNFYCDKDWMMDRIDQWEWDMKMLKKQAPYAAIQYIRKGIGYDEFLREYAAGKGISEEELLTVLEEIQQSSREYQTVEEWFAHVENYKEMLEKQKAKGGREAADRDGVTLMTMHGAKGLEYEVVFVIEGNEGITPYKKAKTKEALEEERRLFYVAMTRAKSKLIISYVKEKNGKDVSPSRFVEELILV